MDFEKILNQLVEMSIAYGPKLLLAIFTLFFGLIIINNVAKGVSRILSIRKIDASLVTFLNTLVSTLLKILLVFSVLGMVGVEVTSFVAFLGAAGLAVGLALQGSLQNFAGGVMILLFKPYKVGDRITTEGYTGEVKEIQIFHTVLLTVENHTIIVPNSPIATNSLTNYSAQNSRRIDVIVPIANNSDIQKVRKVLVDTISASDLFLKAPTPCVNICEYGVGTINICINGWAKPELYWDAFFFINEIVKSEFEKHGIAFPIPAQRQILVQG